MLLIGPEGLLHKHRKLMPTMQERLFHGVGGGDDLGGHRDARRPHRRADLLGEPDAARPLGASTRAGRRSGSRRPPTTPTAGWPRCATSRSSPARSSSRCRSTSPAARSRDDFPAEIDRERVYGRGGAVIVEPPGGDVIAGPLYDREGIARRRLRPARRAARQALVRRGRPLLAGRRAGGGPAVVRRSRRMRRGRCGCAALRRGRSRTAGIEGRVRSAAALMRGALRSDSELKAPQTLFGALQPRIASLKRPTCTRTRPNPPPPGRTTNLTVVDPARPPQPPARAERASQRPSSDPPSVPPQSPPYASTTTRRPRTPQPAVHERHDPPSTTATTRRSRPPRPAVHDRHDPPYANATTRRTVHERRTAPHRTAPASATACDRGINPAAPDASHAPVHRRRRSRDVHHPARREHALERRDAARVELRRARAAARARGPATTPRGRRGRRRARRRRRRRRGCGLELELIAGQAARVAGAVEALVVVEHEPQHARRRSRRARAGAARRPRGGCGSRRTRRRRAARASAARRSGRRACRCRAGGRRARARAAARAARPSASPTCTASIATRRVCPSVAASFSPEPHDERADARAEERLLLRRRARSRRGRRRARGTAAAWRRSSTAGIAERDDAGELQHVADVEAELGEGDGQLGDERERQPARGRAPS